MTLKYLFQNTATNLHLNLNLMNLPLLQISRIISNILYKTLKIDHFPIQINVNTVKNKVIFKIQNG